MNKDQNDERESQTNGGDYPQELGQDHDEDHENPNHKYKKVKPAEDQEESGQEGSATAAASVERTFEGQEVPSWRDQLTVRAIVVSFVLSILFSFIVMKFNLTVGVVPSLNVSAGLLGFFFVKTWTKFLAKSGMLKQAFTRQENTVIQTCVVASSGIAFSGGYGSYLFAMSERIAKNSSDTSDVKNLDLKWIIGFLFVVSFLGLFSVAPLRKIMIIDFKLTYPSGTATAYLINSFHTPKGAKLANFLWGFFQWFYTAGDDCGFTQFPSLGLKARDNRFYFDFSASYIGAGMICPHIVNISVLLGGILSWGVMWPLIDTKKGDWYPEQLAGTMHGLQGYRVFIAIAIILGDGLYNFFKVLTRTLYALHSHLRRKTPTAATATTATDLPLSYHQHRDHNSPTKPNTTQPSFDEQRRTHFFLKDQIPTSVAAAGYAAIAVASTATLPHIFPQLKWYYIVAIYAVAPALAFCNAYGCGLTDWSLASTYGKLAIFTIGAWAGSGHGGVIAGLAACGVMMNIVSTASDLTQDFKTGYLTLASPRSMFLSQVIGTAMGCVISPCVFWLFYKAFANIGNPESPYPAPYAVVYRNMAILGVEGFSSLPKYCVLLCCIFFAVAVLINLVRDMLGTQEKGMGRFIPIPMAMAIPFYIGPYFAIDMCVGSLVVYVWERLNKAEADAFVPAVASGLICGDGIWSLPSSILALAGVKPPICMKFLSRATNDKVTNFLASAS